MARPVWFVELIKKPFPHRFFLARLTRIRLLGKLVDRLLFAGDDIFYLPRDQVIPVGEEVGNPGELVLPSRVVEHFIKQAGFLWLMDACICREANHCQDYPVELGCLFLGDAARGINPKLGRPVTQEEALLHVRRCQEAGLVHMVGRNRLDTVWLGVGPGERLLTVCNCCPCCCLWRMLPAISPDIGARVSRMPGVSVAVTGACSGCGRCTDGICFVDAIRLVDGHAVISEACRGCGRCVSVCPQQAIELSIVQDHAHEETISRIGAVVDLS